MLEQTIAVGDGANDLPMLSQAGLGVAYHAKSIVKESAQHAISNFGLDAILYLIGFSDLDIEQALGASVQKGPKSRSSLKSLKKPDKAYKVDADKQRAFSPNQ